MSTAAFDLDAVVNVLLVTENVYDPRLGHGTLTRPSDVELALRDEGIRRPAPELVSTVLALVEARRPPA